MYFLNENVFLLNIFVKWCIWYIIYLRENDFLNIIYEVFIYEKMF